MQQDEDSSKLKEAAVGAVTEGNADSFAAASRGEKASVQNSLEAGSGAMEAATHQQGETDSHSELPKNLPRVSSGPPSQAKQIADASLLWQVETCKDGVAYFSTVQSRLRRKLVAVVMHLMVRCSGLKVACHAQTVSLSSLCF